MFSGVYLNCDTSKLMIAERLENGSRRIMDTPLVLEYYVPDARGKYVGIDGVVLRKIAVKNLRQFYQVKKEEATKKKEDPNYRTYGLDANITHQTMYKFYKQNYGECPTPELHKSFFDIEVDLGNEKGVSIAELIEKGHKPINAISIYNNWEQKLYTAALYPPTLEKEEADAIIADYPDALLFDDEKKLIKQFIQWFSDADLTAGWNNCLRCDSTIWLPNRIKRLDKVVDGTELIDSRVVKVSDVYAKPEVQIKLSDGTKIYASEDHIFPVFTLGKENYTHWNKDKTLIDKTVSEIQTDMIDKAIFMKGFVHKNTNPALTYRDLLVENIDKLHGEFDIKLDIPEIKIDYGKSRTKQKCYSRVYNSISADTVKGYLIGASDVRIYTKYSGHFDMHLDDVIPAELFHLLGALYTDGSKDKDTLLFYNKNLPFILKIEKLLEQFRSLPKPNNKKTEKRMYGGVYRNRTRLSSVFGLLARCFVYNDVWKKSLNGELFSLCSQEQFDSFLSGCIDGDGWVCKNLDGVRFCNYNGDIPVIAELCKWNDYIVFVQSAEQCMTFSKMDNPKLKERMDLWVDYKAERLKKLHTGVGRDSAAKGKDTKVRVVGDTVYLRVESIEKTGELVSMMDICTNTSYFYTKGIKTHNCKFDVPYIIQRIKTLFADEGEEAVNEVLESLSPFHVLPRGKEKTTEFGDKYTEYDIPGVWSADMMVIYKKHTTHEHESYKLDNIADEELGERKVAYEGTLDDLFRDDFKTFIDYNRQDTMLVYKLDKKTNYLNLHNMQAHELMIPLDVTMGTVGWFSQAVINYAKDHDQIVPDRWEARQAQWEGIKAPGAFVQNPVPGLHQWVSDMDMTSLYPSVIRCLNMSPETIVGQMRLEYTLPYLKDKIVKNGLWEKLAKRIPNWAKAWSGDEMFGTFEYQLIMKKSDAVITCDYEDGKVYKMTGAQWYDFIFNQGNQLCISAFGTLYRTDKEGIVPALLTKWFGERKAYKKKMKAYEDMLDGVELPPDFDRGALEAELKKLADIRTVENEFEVKVVTGLLSVKNYKDLAVYMVEHNLKLGNKFIASGNIEYLESKQKLYDLQQYVSKIYLNSSYGACLSEFCVAYDFRLGASTTLTGRLVTKHMAERINDYTIKKRIYTGGTLIGGDTDSNYFSIGCKAFREANPDFVYTKENVVQYVNKLTAYVDGTFAEAMKEHHHVDDAHAVIMHCAREIVGDYGLYIKKKRYAIMVYDDEGHRQDVNGKPGKMKIRGIQTQRADMPKAVKKLLKDMLVKVLTGGTEQEVQKMIVDFSQSEWDVEPWKKGTPKPVNKFNQYMEKLKEGCDGMTAQKITIPSQVRGAINWNNLIDYYGDTQTKKFAGGEKCLMCKLKSDNMLKLDVVCIPIDIDPTTIPQWFKDLPFDAERTDEAVINKTIDSIFGILGWDLHLSSLTKAVVDDSDLDIQML